MKAFLGRFEDQVDKLNAAMAQAGRNLFKFVFLDPKGWKDIPMSAVQPLLAGRSSEVLINLNTKDINRFLEEPTREASYQRLFGRPEVLDILQEVPMGERAERAVQEYCRSLHRLCGFKYVSQAIIFDPERDEVLYSLVYGTNHHRGVEVFKSAEIEAAHLQTSVRHEVEVAKTGQTSLFDAAVLERSFAKNLRARYSDRAQRKVARTLLESAMDNGPSKVRYSELFCDAMAFPLVTPQDLLGWIASFAPAAELVLSGSKNRKVPDCDEDDWVFVHDRKYLACLA